MLTKKYLMIVPLISFFILAGNLVYAGGVATHTEGMGGYSGVFFSYESSRGLGRMFVDQKNMVMKQSMLITTHYLMYPGKAWSWGIEAPFLQKRITKYPQNELRDSYQINGFGDIRVVTKYQFGIYQKYHLFHRERTFKAAVTLIGNLKLPSAPNNSTDSQDKLVPVGFQLGTGSSDLTLGFMVHTDTEKYFRIHGHLLSSFPVAHREFKPGLMLSYTVSFIMVRMGVLDNIYPLLAVKGAWSVRDKWQTETMLESGGYRLYLTPGIRSVWWYWPQNKTLLMIETGLSIKVLQSKYGKQDSAIGFYLGTRLYFR